MYNVELKNTLIFCYFSKRFQHGKHCTIFLCFPDLLLVWHWTFRWIITPGRWFVVAHSEWWWTGAFLFVFLNVSFGVLCRLKQIHGVSWILLAAYFRHHPYFAARPTAGAESESAQSLLWQCEGETHSLRCSWKCDAYDLCFSPTAWKALGLANNGVVRGSRPKPGTRFLEVPHKGSTLKGSEVSHKGFIQVRHLKIPKFQINVQTKLQRFHTTVWH